MVFNIFEKIVNSFIYKNNTSRKLNCQNSTVKSLFILGIKLKSDRHVLAMEKSFDCSILFRIDYTKFKMILALKIDFTPWLLRFRFMCNGTRGSIQVHIAAIGNGNFMRIAAIQMNDSPPTSLPN